MKRLLAIAVCGVLLSSCSSGGTSGSSGGSPVVPPVTAAGGSMLTALPQHYTVVDLGAGVQPVRVNANGHVAGTISPTQSDVVFFYDGSMHKLATGTASDMNDSDVIVGYAQNGGAIFNLNGTITYLPPPPGGYAGDIAAAINDAGQIAGGAGPACPYDLTIFNESGGSTVVGGSASDPMRINAAGQIIHQTLLAQDAESCGSGGQLVPELYPRPGRLPLPANFSTLPSAEATGTDINASGEVVGWYMTAGANGTIGGISSFYYHDGAMQEIDAPGGPNNGTAFAARAINTQGWIAGNIQTPNPATTGAYVWIDGKFTNLNSLLPAGCSWVLQTVWDLNDAGYIVGTGTFNGATHGYLLIPAT